MVNQYTLFLLLIVSALNVFAADTLQVKTSTQDIIILEDSPAALKLLTELNEKTSLVISASSDIKSSIAIDKGTYTLDSIIRILDSQYSTVKGFDSNKNLLSIGILPLGKSPTASVLQPVSELLEARSQTPSVIKVPSSGIGTQEIPERIDINNMTKEDWQNLSPRETANVKRELSERRTDETRIHDKAERQKVDQDFINSLEEIRNSNPEFYEILLKRHKKRIERIRAERND